MPPALVHACRIKSHAPHQPTDLEKFKTMHTWVAAEITLSDLTMELVCIACMGQCACPYSCMKSFHARCNTRRQTLVTLSKHCRLTFVCGGGVLQLDEGFAVIHRTWKSEMYQLEALVKLITKLLQYMYIHVNVLFSLQCNADVRNHHAICFWIS